MWLEEIWVVESNAWKGVSLSIRQSDFITS
jgi:hypothetical protein